MSDNVVVFIVEEKKDGVYWEVIGVYSSLAKAGESHSEHHGDFRERADFWECYEPGCGFIISAWNLDGEMTSTDQRL